MSRVRFKKSLIIIAGVFLFAMPVYAKDNTGDADEDVQQEQVEIDDEEVPLGLQDQETFDRYKMDVLLMLFIGTVIVTTTVCATIIEKRERKKFN